MEKSERLFRASEGMKHEYCAKIVRVGQLRPVPDAEFLEQTLIDGFPVVVRKGTVSEGQVVVYCMNETQLNARFLSANNQYEYAERDRNANARQVEAMVAEGRQEEARRMVGFMNKHGRVKLIRLRGCPSYGLVFTQESLARWKPDAGAERLEDYLVTDAEGYEHPFDFDTVGNELFAKAYVPPIPPSRLRRKERQRNARLRRFDRLVQGQFAFHYDTIQLQGNMWRFKPETPVTVSVKMHGTSVVVGNVLTRIPTPLSLAKRMSNRTTRRRMRALERERPRAHGARLRQEREAQLLRDRLFPDFRLGYGNITSSRTVIKNREINPGVGQGFYEGDIWNEYGQLLMPLLDEGMTVYAEICGYLSGSRKMIQPSYDYGCAEGENFLMPYRITSTDAEGNHTEWEVERVARWTLRMTEEHPDLRQRLRPLHILYRGTFGDLYPELGAASHWHEAVLERLKEDREHFGMEQREPLCRQKVPREGIVVRIDGDRQAEAFKLKCSAFMLRESQRIGDAPGDDIEMTETYG